VTALHVALCIALCAAGHLVRDGWPPLGSTQLARLAGAFLCFAGALEVQPHGWHAAVIAGAVYAGFYADSRHGEGNEANSWRSIGFLALSGVTSLGPLALTAALVVKGSAGFLCLAGLTKCAIWPLCWWVKPDRWLPGVYPTRVAATLFGAVVGAIVAALLG
jgi:hypothetical protein